MSNQQCECTLQERLQSATVAELNRLCQHLTLKENTCIKEIEKAYLNAADNSIFYAIRKVIPIDAPTYSKTLRLIFREMRPYTATFIEVRARLKSLKFWNYRASIENIDDKKLEGEIFSMYAKKYANANNKRITSSGFWKNILRSAPAFLTTASPAALAAKLIPGPIGISLSIICLGSLFASPAYKKIIPATVELMIIGRRINCMPEE